jgi:hypothetical protein
MGGYLIESNDLNISTVKPVYSNTLQHMGFKPARGTIDKRHGRLAMRLTRPRPSVEPNVRFGV